MPNRGDLYCGVVFRTPINVACMKYFIIVIIIIIHCHFQFK